MPRNPRARQAGRRIPFVELPALRDQFRVPAVRHIEHDHRDTKIVSDHHDPGQAIGEQIAAGSLSAKPGIDADHRDIDGGDRTKSRSVTRLFWRQFGIIDLVRIDRVEADQLPRRIDHHEDPEIIGLDQLVRGLLEEVCLRGAKSTIAFRDLSPERTTRGSSVRSP